MLSTVLIFLVVTYAGLQMLPLSYITLNQLLDGKNYKPIYTPPIIKKYNECICLEMMAEIGLN